MITGRDVPERWRVEYDLAEEINLSLGSVLTRKLISELGTAESLVRDLAKAVLWLTVPAESEMLPDGKDKWCRFCKWMLHEKGHCPGCEVPEFEDALSRVPKELLP